MKDTKGSHTINSTKYTKERYSLHQRIVSMIERPDSSPKKGHKPIAVLIGGGTASGKTTMRKRMIEKELHSKLIRTTVVDFDEIKEYIPEYSVYKKIDANQAATLVHKESCDIGVLLLKKLIKDRKNFIFEGTMARTRRYKSLVNQLRKHGYDILVYVADVPILVAKKRADERARLTGRKIPHKVIENTHKLVPRTFLEIKDVVDRYRIYDNQNGFVLIASNSFIDRRKYSVFLKKGSYNKTHSHSGQMGRKDPLLIKKYESAADQLDSEYPYF